MPRAYFYAYSLNNALLNDTKVNDLVTVTLTFVLKMDLSDFVAAGGIVFQKHMYFCNSTPICCAMSIFYIIDKGLMKCKSKYFIYSQTLHLSISHTSAASFHSAFTSVIGWRTDIHKVWYVLQKVEWNSVVTDIVSTKHNV